MGEEERGEEEENGGGKEEVSGLSLGGSLFLAVNSSESKSLPSDGCFTNLPFLPLSFLLSQEINTFLSRCEIMSLESETIRKRGKPPRKVNKEMKEKWRRIRVRSCGDEEECLPRLIITQDSGLCSLLLSSILNLFKDSLFHSFLFTLFVPLDNQSQQIVLFSLPSKPATSQKSGLIHNLRIQTMMLI